MSTVLFNSDFEAAEDILAPYIPSIRGVIANAIAGERERCAKLAERFCDQGRDGHQIAKAIREKSPE